MSKIIRWALVFAFTLPLIASIGVQTSVSQTTTTCTGEFIPVSPPLNDLGNGEYVRLNTGRTGYTGGLYPGGSNVRPPAHEAAGLALAQQIAPRDTAGRLSSVGRIVLLSIGMSNTFSEFRGFSLLARSDPTFNRRVALVNGAQPGMVATEWVDPNAAIWTDVDDLLLSGGLSPLQVEVAWIKLTNYDLSSFPQSIQKLRDDLRTVVRNLKVHYPNVKLAYLSSRTRSYTYWEGLNPEPGAFETGFAVKWLIEAQISGSDPGLNYDPARGPVVAPYLSWGPYLWIDGLNPRSDGMVWTQADMVGDCTHPSQSGIAKVATQLLNFFKRDATTRPWFLTSRVYFYFPLVDLTGN